MEGGRSNNYEGDYHMDMKNGWGFFEWESGNTYRGRYVDDEREGFGEMRWTDGSVYRGNWHKGVQNGIGIMFFPNGERRSGLFEQNVFKISIVDIKEYDDWFKGLEANDKDAAESIPKDFREEVREYIDDLESSFGSPVQEGAGRLNLPSSDDDLNKQHMLVNTTFKQVEMEDKTEVQAFKESNRGFNQSQ